MYYLYLMDSFDPKKNKTKEFALKAISDYCYNQGINHSFEVTDFQKSEKGKPFLEEGPAFSISHSENILGILVGPNECGLDIQKKTSCKALEITRRYFGQEEVQLVREDEDAFFRLWTMREAYGKYLGQGFFGSKTQYVYEGELVEEIDDKTKKVYFNKIDMGSDLFCTCATLENQLPRICFLD